MPTVGQLVHTSQPDYQYGFADYLLLGKPAEHANLYKGQGTSCRLDQRW